MAEATSHAHVKAGEDLSSEAWDHFLFEVPAVIRDPSGQITFTGTLRLTDNYQFLGMTVPLHVGDPSFADWGSILC